LEYHLIVGDSTPETGGMSAHMALLADGLARRSNVVHIWAPARAVVPVTPSPSIVLHHTLGTVDAADFRRTGQLLDGFPSPRRLLVYWVPHAYGHRGMNLPFCLWLRKRSKQRGDRVELLLQECFLDVGVSWRQTAAAAVQRLMTTVLLNAADRIWISIPRFEQVLRPYALGRRVDFTWLPVPSNIAVVRDDAATADVRRRFAPRRLLVGHFGTYRSDISDLMVRLTPEMLRRFDATLVLLGSGGKALADQLTAQHADLRDRVHAIGYLDDAALSAHLSACDVVLQPYPDGLTSRRGSALAGLAHGRPIITNRGPFTEPLWDETQSVLFAPEEPQPFLAAIDTLMREPPARGRLGAAAAATYEKYFSPERMVELIERNG
jgi:glycosyltransferase involved in cell wall biosynthesis